MADLFIIRERLKFSLKLAAAGVGLGVFSTWYFWSQLEFATDRSQFLLSAVITGGLAVGWLGILMFYMATKRVVNPSHNLTGGVDSLPRGLFMLILVLLVIGVLGIYIYRTSSQSGSEFDLLRRGSITLLKERIVANPSVLERLESKGGPTLIQMAYREGYHKAIGVLVEAGADVEDLDAQGRNPIIVSLDNLPLLESLLAAGFNPELSDTEGMPPIHHAVLLHSADAIAALLEGGAMLGARDNIFRTPLLLAVETDDLSMIRVLLEKGADVNEYDKRGDTPLHKAARRRNTKSMVLLLENGADPRFFNFAQMTPLHLVAQGGHLDLVSILLEIPDMTGLRGENDVTPLDLALKGRKYDTAKLLIEHGSDINRVLANGDMLLHQAVLNRDYQVARFLIREGGDVNIPNAKGETAHDIMRRKQLYGLLDLIEERDNPAGISRTNLIESAGSL